MTKLLKFLSVITALITLYFSFIYDSLKNTGLKQYPNLLLFLPLFVVAAIGVGSFAIILYRVLTFNDCAEAAAELQQEIKEAKSDLERKGFEFKAH